MKKIAITFLFVLILALSSCIDIGNSSKTDTATGTSSTTTIGVIDKTTTDMDDSTTTTINGGDEMLNYWNDDESFGIRSVDGVMYLRNEKVYKCGVNCYNLFNQCLNGFDPSDAYAVLDIMKQNGIEVIRFNMGVYYPSEMGYYFEHKSEYMSLIGKIAAYAERLEIGLIPSFIWNQTCIPDYYDEPLTYWGKQDSKTVAFLKEYTTTIVSKLKNYKSIFAWEFGNEINLACDLPNASEHVPPLPVGSKRTSRSEEDYISALDMKYAFQVFSDTIKSIDKTGRMIDSGNATLRPSQYNQLHYNSWTQDTYDEYKEITSVFLTGMDCVSEHVYFTSQKTFGRELSLSVYTELLMQMCSELSVPYFVGEWGGGSSNDYDYYKSIGQTFVEKGVQLMLFWNYNLHEGQIEYSFSLESERGRMIMNLLKELNEEYIRLYA